MPEPIIDVELFSDVFAATLGDNIRDGISARLGKPSTGEVMISLDNTDLPGSVYIHGIGSSGATPSIENDTDEGQDDTSVGVALILPNKIPDGMLVYNCPVLVRKRGGQYYVEDLDGIRALEFLFGLKDRTQRSVDISQLDYGLARPANPPSLRILVSRARYDFNGTIYDVPALLSDDMTSYIPGSGLARAVRVDIKIPDKILVLTAGDPFDINLPHEGAFDTYYPHTVPEGQFTSTWVRLYSGITQIGINDMYSGQEIYTKTSVPLDAADILGQIVTQYGEVVTANGKVVYYNDSL